MYDYVWFRACGKGCTNSNETFFPLHPMMSMFLATSSCPGVASKADASMARLLRGVSPRHADDPCCSHIFVSHCSYRKHQLLTNTDFELLHDLNMKSPFLMLNLAFWAETVKQTREIPVNQEAAIVKPEAKNWESEVPWIHTDSLSITMRTMQVVVLPLDFCILACVSASSVGSSLWYNWLGLRCGLLHFPTSCYSEIMTLWYIMYDHIRFPGISDVTSHPVTQDQPFTQSGNAMPSDS